MLAVYLNNNKDGMGLSGLEDYKNVNAADLDVLVVFQAPHAHALFLVLSIDR